MANNIKLEVSIKDMQPFKVMKEIISDVIQDRRIPVEVREEYANKLIDAVNKEV